MKVRVKARRELQPEHGAEAGSPVRSFSASRGAGGPGHSFAGVRVHPASGPGRGSSGEPPIQRVKVRVKDEFGDYKELETNNRALDWIESLVPHVHPEDRDKLDMAIRMARQMSRPLEDLRREADERDQFNRGARAFEEDARDEPGWELDLALDKMDRLAPAMAYYSDPREIARLTSASNEETDRLLPDSPELRAHRVSELQKAGGKMAASKVLDAATAGGVSGVLDTAHTAYQGLTLPEVPESQPEAREAVGTLSSSRLKKSATQGASTAASTASGAAVGGAVGSLIPVPVLGTVVGAAVGGGVGFAAGKLVDKGAQKLIDDSREVADSVMVIHEHARGGEPWALEIFEKFGIDERAARGEDGWKALAAKTGGDFGGRGADPY